jgi:hypothetical protein
MAGRIKIWLIGGALLVSLAAQGQQQSVQPAGRLDFAVTYNAAYAGLAPGNQQFWLNGGSAELAGQLYRGLGVVANVTGLHAANTGAGVPLNLLTTTFGPRYTWTPVHRSASARTVSIFGEGLVGEAHGFDSLFPGLSGANTSALSLAVQVGGGIDIGLSKHLSLRAVQASWLRTQLPNTTTNVQNNLLLGAGVVFHTRSH